MVLPIKAVDENIMKSGYVDFLIKGPLVYNIERRSEGENPIIHFGKFSKTSIFLYGAIIIVSILSTPLLVSNGVPNLVAVLPLMAVIISFIFFFFKQKELKKIQFELSPKQCLLKWDQSTQSVNGIEAIVVLNTHRDRNGGRATEGVSELFIQMREAANCRFVPLVSDPNHGSLDDLGRYIANAICVDLEIIERG